MIKAGETDNAPRRARLARTLLFFRDRKEWRKQLEKEIDGLIRRAARNGLKPVMRLNGSSDLAFERIFPDLFDKWPSLQWLDYTKSAERYDRFLQGLFPDNYHLTFSRSENNEIVCKGFLARGGTVAIPFDGGFPDAWQGFPVVTGEDHDLRFLDPAGCVVALRPKGNGWRAKDAERRLYWQRV